MTDSGNDSHRLTPAEVAEFQPRSQSPRDGSPLDGPVEPGLYPGERNALMADSPPDVAQQIAQYAARITELLAGTRPPAGVRAPGVDAATLATAEAIGHSCIACPTDVRDLYAVAVNATQAFDAYIAHGDSMTRAVRKIAELTRALDRFRDNHIDPHFAAIHPGR